MNLESLIHRIWYRASLSLGAVLLWPFSVLFSALASVNAWLFKLKIKQSTRLAVPVIVVGNITVGGTGKTPLTIALAKSLQALGWRVGIISRGYGGSASAEHADVVEVLPDSLPSHVGDEPLLMRRALLAAQVPVFVARRRAVAGAALLAAYPAVDVLLCDDGLQHYALARDFEICVIDGARGVGNGLRLPAGPLRESIARLRTVDAVVINGQGVLAEKLISKMTSEQYGAGYPSQHQMILHAGACYRLNDASQTRVAADFVGQALHAVVGIGNPQRFFNTLSGLGLTFTEHIFADHHAFSVADLPALGDSGAIIVTEKDAVKLAALLLGNDTDAVWGDRIWVLPVNAVISPDLALRIATHLTH